MNTYKRFAGTAALLAAGLSFAGVACASPVFMRMNFDSLTAQGEWVDNYYNAGCGSSYSGNAVTCDGPAYGAVWSGALAGGAPGGHFSQTSDEPSPSNVMASGDAPASGTVVLNVRDGFTSLSFWYAAASSPGSVSVYSGQDGNGSVLATVALPVTGSGCGAELYSCWSQITASFTGIAQSAYFTGRQAFVVYDDVTIGRDVQVPEPSAIVFLGLGMILIGGFLVLRRRDVSSA